MIIVDVKIESISRIRYVLQIRISSKLMMTGIYLNTADLESTDKLQKRFALCCLVSHQISCIQEIRSLWHAVNFLYPEVNYSHQ